jgi:hypothetical protein
VYKQVHTFVTVLSLSVSSAVTNEIDVFYRPGPRVWDRKFSVVVRIGLARGRAGIALGLE